MKITHYGAACEVGRSCIVIDDKYLLDAGLKISEEGSEYPIDFDVTEIKYAFISHAHLDHTGVLPIYNFKNMNCSIFCTKMTKDTSKGLLKDSLHIETLQKKTPTYTKENLINVYNNMKITKYKTNYSVDNVDFRFIDAGHIPGSSCIYMHIKDTDKKVLYTGDINLTGTNLLDALKLDDFKDLKDKIDVMIIDSTYGDRNHEDRKEAEKRFIKKIKETMDKGGSVVIPAFAVGRAQEVMILIAKYYNIIGKPKIYLDGMAKEITKLYVKYPDFLNASALNDSLRNVRMIKDWKERKKAMQSQGIFITTSGMLDGGPVIEYLKHFHEEPRHAILMTGYQSEESNGRLLLDEGKVYIDGLRVKVRPHYEKFDFSAHAGQSELIKFIKYINPKNIILQHGDKDVLPVFKKEIENNVKGIKVHIPKLEENIVIK